MAFTIVICESDKQLFDSLKKRLALSFPDAYILSPDISIPDHGLSDHTTVLYDDRKMTAEEAECFGGNGIALYSSGNGSYIDCRVLCELIEQQRKYRGDTQPPAVRSADPVRGKIILLIPYAYISERETFIRNEYFDLVRESTLTLRLDLMSGIRMPSTFTYEGTGSSLTDLLNAAARGSLDDTELLEYLNPDMNGFLVPGRPDNADDVFDAGTDTVCSLIRTVRELTQRKDSDINALIVAEGFTLSDLKKISSLCDLIHILLPSRLCSENETLPEIINGLKSSSDYYKEIKISYTEDHPDGIKRQTDIVCTE